MSEGTNGHPVLNAVLHGEPIITPRRMGLQPVPPALPVVGYEYEAPAELTRRSVFAQAPIEEHPDYPFPALKPTLAEQLQGLLKNMVLEDSRREKAKQELAGEIADFRDAVVSNLNALRERVLKL